MKKIINFEDLLPCLNGFYVQLDKKFLKELLIDSGGLKYRTSRQFAKKIGTKYNEKAKCCTSFGSWFTQNSAMPIYLLLRLQDLSRFTLLDTQKHILYIKSGRTGSKLFLKFPFKVTEEWGTIIGHILGDGSIDKKYGQIFFSNSNPELLHEFQTSMLKIFGVKPRIWCQDKPVYGKTRWLKRINRLDELPKDHNAGLFYSRACGIILKHFFGNFANGSDKNLTTEILECSTHIKRKILRAFFDDEGSISTKNCLARIYQDDMGLLVALKNLLREFSIDSNPVRYYLKRNKKRYMFSIGGFRNYYYFYHRIGCTSTRKAKEFEKLIQRVAKGNHRWEKFRLDSPASCNSNSSTVFSN